MPLRQESATVHILGVGDSFFGIEQGDGKNASVDHLVGQFWEAGVLPLNYSPLEDILILPAVANGARVRKMAARPSSPPRGEVPHSRIAVLPE
jgi:hypothetical protein